MSRISKKIEAVHDKARIKQGLEGSGRGSHKRALEARWRREEAADWARELADADKHRDDCLCAAVKPGFVDGPTCFQKGGKVA